MKMRRGWPEDMPASKIKELQHIIACLQTQMQFEMVVLYGRYAGGLMCSEMGGYELLLISHSNPKIDGWRLEEFLKTEYPIKSRIEQMLHIETVNIHFLNNINTANWFFWNIRMEGTIVYDNSNAVHGFFTSTGFKHVKAYRAAQRSYDYFFTNGSRILDDAERLWSEKKHPQVALMLSYAALFLLRAEETVFFGYFIHTGNLHMIFRHARHFSKALATEFKLKNRFDAELFDKLVELRHAPRNNDDFELSKSQYRYFLGRLRKMQEIVQSSCERHLFYLEHGKTKKEWMDMSHLDGQPMELTTEVTASAETYADPENTRREEQARRITVEVDPVIALTALGLAKGYFPSIVEHIESKSGLRMDEARKRQMLDTLNEIYERCVEQTDVREVADLYLRSELTGKFS